MNEAQELAAQLDKEQIDTLRRDMLNHEAATLLRTQDALLRQALDALELTLPHLYPAYTQRDAITAIKEHLK